MIGKVRLSGRVLPLLLAAGVLAGCGADDATGAGGAGGLSVSVAEPAAGATVSVPFTVTVQASVPLGTTESGRHHVHIWFDDNADDYQVVEAPTTQVTQLSAGKHVMHVSLRNANHSPAGAETQVEITVGDGSGGTQPAPATSAPGSGYGY